MIEEARTRYGAEKAYYAKVLDRFARDYKRHAKRNKEKLERDMRRYARREQGRDELLRLGDEGYMELGAAPLRGPKTGLLAPEIRWLHPLALYLCTYIDFFTPNACGRPEEDACMICTSEFRVGQPVIRCLQCSVVCKYIIFLFKN